MSFLRKNWIAHLIIAIAISWWHIFDLIAPPLLNFEPSLNNADYWSLVTHTSVQPMASLGFFCIAIVAGLLTFWYIVPYWNAIYRLVLLIAVFCLCTLSTWTSRSFGIKDSRTISPIMSVNYQDNVYYLAFYQSVAFMGSVSILYYVFQCDGSGDKCSKIYEEAGGQLFQSKLVVSENKLIYQSSTSSHQIFPAVN